MGVNKATKRSTTYSNIVKKWNKVAKTDATKPTSKSERLLPSVDKSTVKKTTPVQDPTRVFKRNHRVSEEVLTTLTKAFPAWTFQFGNGAPHSHPVGATERAICEEEVYKTITNKWGLCSITDVGGNANRHSVSNRTNIHSCNPILSSNDATRRQPSSYLPEANYCHNKAEDCKFVPDVYMAIHSIYYLTRQDVLTLVHKSKKGELYAVVHRFDDLYGGFHFVDGQPESVYEMSCDGHLSVRMQVKGNLTGYSHDPCLWLGETYFQQGDRAMAWDARPMGDSWIFTFMKSPTGLSTDVSSPMSMIDSLKRDDHYGSVDGVLTYGDSATMRPTLSFLNLSRTKSVSLGRFNVVYSSTAQTVLVPKDLIRTVALKMIGVPRDEAGLRLCIANMKRELTKMNIPMSMKLNCAIYGAAQAFVLTLGDEIAAFNELRRPYHQKLYNRLQQAMSLESFLCCGRYDMVTAAELNVTAIMYNDNRASVPSKPFDARKAWPNGLPGYTSEMPLATRKEKTKLFMPDKVELPSKPQFHANCISFSNYIPVVPNPNLTNEMIALNNRALVNTPDEDKELWREIHDHGRELLKDVVPIEEDPTTLFIRWNSKFPQAKRLLYEKAALEVQRDGIHDKDLMTNMFVKRELTLKGGETPEDFDPRAIQGFSDKLNVCIGPFVWATSKELGKKWDLTSRITYANGMTAEEVGKWREQFGEDDCTIIELDESRYDAHQREGVAILQSILFSHYGIESYELAHKIFEGSYTKRGWSQKGIYYEVDGTMASGDQKTSVANSYLNGTKTDKLIQKYGLHVNSYKILLTGDDSLVVIRGTMNQTEKDKLKAFLVESNHKLGFKTKCKIHSEWYDAEFCSGVFWPVLDGYVLGPKIGRRLPKIGFNLNKLKAGEVKSMLIGIQQECGHIPVLRVYAETCLSMLAGVQTLAYIEKGVEYKNRASKQHTYTTSTELFFLQRYGFEPDLFERELIISLQQARTITDCINFPLLKLLMEIDV